MGAYEVVTPSIEVGMRFTPKVLNLGSRGKWLKAHFVLPEDFGVDDVDINNPAKLWPLGINSDHINVYVGKKSGLVEVVVSFARSDFSGALGDYVPGEMTVGWLTRGKYFYGTGTVKIIADN